MSFKDLFDGATRASAIANKSAKEIGAEVESVGYHTQDIINENRFIPNVDFNDPSTFARYGSAEEYYGQSIERVYDTYPYDGSLKERLEWENSSTYIDLYLLDNQYPRTNGYVLLSANGWGSGGSLVDGYSLPDSTEYIYFKGGPHPNTDGMTPYSNSFTGSNYYEPDANRESNLKFDLTGSGVTVEFWFKKDAWVGNQTKEVVLDLWNGYALGDDGYGRLRVTLDPTADGVNPVMITIKSGTVGVIDERIGTSLTIADSAWHHYALSFASEAAGIATKLYVDGTLNTESTLGSAGINEVTGALRANVGALVTATAGGAPQYAGKLSGSLDEFRYWKTRRSSKDIGRYWFTQVGGGTNSDPTPYSDTQETVNTNLGVYFKFNEGITGEATTDSTVLDYSGRVSNGDWTGYTATSRNTGSAIVLSTAAIKEFKDPIIYSFHPEVVSLKSELESSGSSYDDSNSTSIYKSIPGWITEDDDAGQHQLKNLTQIVSSYFDTLHMQIAEHNKLKDIEYVSGSNKPFPYSNKLLNSQGFISPDIFVDADLFEQLADRSEGKLYEKSLSEIKNVIYQNIYNNLSYIYKTKGTEKAFRNLIRCYGIDDELIKLSMYARNTNYEFRENRRTLLVNDRTINFNHPTNTEATVYSFSSSANPNSTGYIAASTNLTGGYAVTLEADIFFPQKPSEGEAYGYFNTNAISSSLFGVHQARASQTDTGWGNGSENEDATNFQVFSVRDELDSSNVRFTLTGTAGGYVPFLTSPLYEEVYTDTSWNLSTRIRPERFPLATYVSGADTGDYVVELHGVQTRSGEIINTFTVSGAVSPGGDGAKAFMTGSRRVFLGAHKENVTGSTVYQTSDVRVNSCRFWIDYVEDSALASHALDTENYGPRRPGRYASPWDKTAAGTGEVTELDTLAFNWEFSENTGSNALGKFSVADESSGSAALAASRYGFIGTLAGKQITAQGQGFVTSSTDAVKKEFVVVSRLNELEVIAPSEMVTVLDAQEQHVFKVDSRPVNYFYAFEKSMSKIVSEAMVNAFGTLSAFNTLIGKPVNRFRNEYKDLKFLRQKFYEDVGNDEIDFDKFYEFYKWFDSSLSYMLGQLVPASADFAQNIRTTIESTVLERSKYRSVFPFLEQPENDFEASIGSNVDYGDAISSPDDDPQGTGFYPVHAPTRRSVGLTPRSLLQKWKYDHAPEDADQKKNHLWWRDRAERNSPTLTTTTEADTSRAVILQSIKEHTKRNLATPYRFSMAGSRVLGGVGQHQNKDVNFPFAATQPYGPTVAGTHSPLNIMVSLDSDVETLLDTTDEFYPAYKQRLGFGMDPGFQRDNRDDLYTKANGDRIAPFSLYETTVNTGYQAAVSSSFKTGVAVTNLHHDFVADTDIPLQGPFTEKYVGGRAYRHTTINSGPVLDTLATRAEGFRITLGEHGDGKSLAVVPPNSGAEGLGWDPDVPTAQRFRDETAKRPVNIRNIQMRTGSTVLGNYERNYQIIQTAGRTLNDPFFNDQSFDFAPYPETLATRGRFPLGPATHAWQPSSVEFDGNDQYLITDDTDASAWDSVIGGAGALAKTYSVSMWIYPNTLTINDWLWQVGGTSFGADGRMIAAYSGNKLSCRSGPTNTWARSNALSLGVWNHVVFTFPGGGAGDGGTWYIDGNESTDDSNFSNPPETISGTDMRIAGIGSSGFDGYLCDFAIWRSELDSDDVEEIYNGGSRFKLTDAAAAGSLISWWKLGDGEGDSYEKLTDEQGFALATPINMGDENIVEVSPPADSNLAPYNPYDTPNPGGALSYALPARTGSDSNQTVIVNRFAGCGYEVMSRGYMDPAHEEMSVYNALPYRDLAIIDYGLSGSASVDRTLERTIRVQDQLNKVRGLDQRASLHCGPFGSDAAYGTVPELTYVTKPSWHKTNRNPATRPEVLGTESPVVPSVAWSVASSSLSPRLQMGTLSDWNSAIGGTGGSAQSWSISTWFYIDAEDTGGTAIWLLGTAVSTAGRSFYIQSGVGNFRGANTNDILATSFSTDRWYHVVGTYDAEEETVNCYVNGVLDSNFPKTGITIDPGSAITTNPLCLGNLHTSVNYDLIGELAEFLVYDKAITQSEVTALYGSGLVPRSTPSTTNLIARYVFSTAAGDTTSNIYNQVAGGSVYDSSFRRNYSLKPEAVDGLTYPAVTTYTTEKVYDNLYVQHQIPRSEQQYSWITGSILPGTTIYGLDAASCVSASSLSQLVTGASMPQHAYYSSSYQQNFAGYSGRLVIDSVDEQEHLQYANKYSPLDVGTYSGKFSGASGTSVYLGSATTWNGAIGTSAVTISMWFNTHEAVADGSFIPLITFGGGSGSLTGQIVVWIDTATMTIRFQRKGGSGSTNGVVKSTTTIETGKWYHVTVTYDGTNPGGSGTAAAMKIYVDAVDVTDSPAVSELTSPDAIATNGGRIGYATNFGDFSSHYFKGYLTDVAIWDDDLTSDNVVTLYNGGRPVDLTTAAPDSSDLIAWWKFNPFAGDTAATIINQAPVPIASTNASGSGGYPRLTRFSPNSVDGLNILLNNRQGPYGWPTWKQIRTGETSLAAKLRRTNKIGTVLPPPLIPQDSSPGLSYQYVRGKQANTFVDYTEQPISSRYKPTMVCLEDNTEEANVANNLSLNVAYGNMLDHFSNQGLNNRLNVPAPSLYNNALNAVFEYVTGSNLTAIVDYTERLYPAETNAYKNIIRRRTQFDINNIWNGNRNFRSTKYGGQTNSQGVGPNSLLGVPNVTEDSSTWPLDPHLDFTTTSSVLARDGSGELMNSYSRFYADQPDDYYVAPGATYASRILIYCTSSGDSIKVRAGDTEWLAPLQSGKDPYDSYDTYSHRMALAAKDHSIIPEFRISALMDRYVEINEGDFLADLDNIFELTGAAIADSSEANFFKTYSNSDFLKYFSVVDESLNNKRAGDLKLNRNRVSLQCSAFLKFLPYKGFYPAERTLELASIFSQSYGPVTSYNNASSPYRTKQVFRAILEPMYAPGIMYNTIKSGIAVSNFIIVNTSASFSSYYIPSASSQNTPFPEGVVKTRAQLVAGITLGYGFKKLPFETLYRPFEYLSSGSIVGDGSIYDTGVNPETDRLFTEAAYGQASAKLAQPSRKLYELAIDNFLCETVNFYNDSLTSFVSKREDQFEPVISGSEYIMDLNLFRSMDVSGNADRSQFEMYSRATAFGAPMTFGPVVNPVTLTHLTPPYFSGSAAVKFTYTAQYTGVPTLDEILSNTTLTYSRAHQPQGTRSRTITPGGEQEMQVDSCFNLKDYFGTVPRGQVSAKNSWLIQSKFETPVLNFASVSSSRPPTCTVAGDLTNPSDLVTKGMWHQYGAIPTSSAEGIFASIQATSSIDQSSYSLAKIVGFPAGAPRRIGNIKKENVLEEAVIAVPFRIRKNRRDFFPLRQRSTRNGSNQQFVRLRSLMNKYVFPPKFDFMRHRSVNPILMYAFEFSTPVTQQDIADMWQNLPPDIANSFEQKTSTVTIEEREIIEALTDNTEQIRWMVFKVKKRAKKDYEKYRRSLVTSDTSAIPAEIGSYSYNWPYDFFSLVELVKIGETVRYASKDLTPVAPSIPGGTTRTSPGLPTGDFDFVQDDTATTGVETAEVTTEVAPQVVGFEEV